MFKIRADFEDMYTERECDDCEGKSYIKKEHCELCESTGTRWIKKLTLDDYLYELGKKERS